MNIEKVTKNDDFGGQKVAFSGGTKVAKSGIFGGVGGYQKRGKKGGGRGGKKGHFEQNGGLPT